MNCNATMLARFEFTVVVVLELVEELAVDFTVVVVTAVPAAVVVVTTVLLGVADVASVRCSWGGRPGLVSGCTSSVGKVG